MHEEENGGDVSRFLFSLSVEEKPRERKNKGKYQSIHEAVKQKIDTLKKGQVLKINSLSAFGNSKRDDKRLTRNYAAALYQFAKMKKWGIKIEQDDGKIIISKGG